MTPCGSKLVKRIKIANLKKLDTAIYIKNIISRLKLILPMRFCPLVVNGS